MSNTSEFLTLLTEKMSDLVQDHELVVVESTTWPNFYEVIYSNPNVSISCSLERPDGYMDFQFGPATIMNPIGIPQWPESEKMVSLRMILKSEGISLPSGREELYAKGKMEEAVELLVQGLRDHEELVFGTTIYNKE